MAHTRTAEEQTAFEAFQNAPPLFDALADTPASEPDAAAVPATDGAPVVVADASVVVPEVVTPSWRDDIIRADEGMPPVWVGRKRGEYTDAQREDSTRIRDIAQQAQREKIELEAELKALRDGRVILPPKPDAQPAAPPPMPYGLENDDEAYRQLPKVIRDIHEQNAALTKEVKELRDAQQATAFERIKTVCDNAFSSARKLVNPAIPEEAWGEWWQPAGRLMAMQEPPIDPSNPEGWAWAARQLKLDRVLAPASAAPAPTQIVPRSVGAPLVGNSAPSAPLVAADTDTRRSTGNAEIDAVATEVVQFANRRAAREGEGRKPIDANAVMEQYLKSRGGKR